MGDRGFGFNVLRRLLSPVITGSKMILSIPGAWGFASRFARLLRPHRALADASLPPATIFRPQGGSKFARLRLAKVRFRGLFLIMPTRNITTPRRQLFLVVMHKKEQ